MKPTPFGITAWGALTLIFLLVALSGWLGFQAAHPLRQTAYGKWLSITYPNPTRPSRTSSNAGMVMGLAGLAAFGCAAAFRSALCNRNGSYT